MRIGVFMASSGAQSGNGKARATHFGRVSSQTESHDFKHNKTDTPDKQSLSFQDNNGNFRAGVDQSLNQIRFFIAPPGSITQSPDAGKIPNLKEKYAAFFQM
jgi:hypothetical protein